MKYFRVGILQEDGTIGDSMRISANSKRNAALKYRKIFGRFPTYGEPIAKETASA